MKGKVGMRKMALLTIDSAVAVWKSVVGAYKPRLSLSYIPITLVKALMVAAMFTGVCLSLKR